MKHVSAIGVVIVFLIGLVGVASAQAATFSWTPGVGGDPATKYTLKCSTTAGGPYTAATQDVTGTPLPTSVSSSFITSPIKLFCVVTASNVRGESSPSNEVVFPAVPNTPTNLQVGP